MPDHRHRLVSSHALRKQNCSGPSFLSSVAVSSFSLIPLSFNQIEKAHNAKSIRVVVPTIIRILFLQQTTTTPVSRTDHTFTLTNSTLITEVVMHFSLIAATFPCLRKFLQAFDMHMGATTNLTSAGDTTSSSIALKSLERSPNPNNEIYRAMPQAPGMGNVTVICSATPRSQDSRERLEVTPVERRSEESDGSQRVMIRKTQRWEVVSSSN